MPGASARTALAGTRFRDLRWVESTTSTQRDVLELARQGAPEGAVVVADHQSGGRGRAGRIWEAPPGTSMLASVLLRPPAPLAGLVTATLALSAQTAIESVAGFCPGLKWPNDLVYDDGTSTRKIGGILAEADWPAGADIAGGWREPAPHERVTVVAGIGINVNWPDELPPELADTAVACNHVTGHAVDRESLVVEFFTQLELRYGSLLDDGPGPTLERWRNALTTLGRAVRVDLGGDDVHGRAVDVDADGHLVVETAEGERKTFAVGDVHHLRDAR